MEVDYGGAMAVPTLSAEEVAAALTGLPDWSGGTDGISRTLQARSFLAGIDLVDRVADAAEEADHHPDIDIRWRTLTFRLVTHSVGGVTEKDIALARRINALAAED
jgi:4a-hydroxytetrahydrobiopterin dehydratase